MPASRGDTFATREVKIAAGHLNVPDSVYLAPQFAPVGMVSTVLTSLQRVVAVSQRVGQHGVGVGFELGHGAPLKSQRNGQMTVRGCPVPLAATPIQGHQTRWQGRFEQEGFVYFCGLVRGTSDFSGSQCDIAQALILISFT